MQNLPHLEILPVEKLILHENHDQQRTPPIIQSIEEDGLLRNPPIVVPLEDGSGRYMVLDGANRATALRDMGVPHTIAQIVNVDNPGLELTSWNHLVWGNTPQTLLKWMQSVVGVHLLPGTAENPASSLLDEGSLAILHLANGQIYRLGTKAIGLVERVRLLNELVDSYAKRASLDRTMSDSIEPLQGLYADFSGLVLLPAFRIEDVLYLGSYGHLLPKGITRFIISGRALHINIPLGFLFNSQTLEQKRVWLQGWLQDRFSRKGVRYYAEPVFMFDE